MFLSRQRTMLLHLTGRVIHTSADHPFFVQGQGWTQAVDLHPGDPLLCHDGQSIPLEGISASGAQEVVYNLLPEGYPMPGQNSVKLPNKPILGFAAGTPLLTPDGYKPIEELKTGEFLLSQPDDQDIDKSDGSGEDSDSTGEKDSEK